VVVMLTRTAARAAASLGPALMLVSAALRSLGSAAAVCRGPGTQSMHCHSNVCSKLEWLLVLCSCALFSG
jgi:hypothetical protein